MSNMLLLRKILLMSNTLLMSNLFVNEKRVGDEEQVLNRHIEARPTQNLLICEKKNLSQIEARECSLCSPALPFHVIFKHAFNFSWGDPEVSMSYNSACRVNARKDFAFNAMVVTFVAAHATSEGEK